MRKEANEANEDNETGETEVTVEQSQPGGQVQQWSGTTTGLEDFSVSDAVLPRIKIEHDTGLWVENLNSNKYQVLRFIPLGLVKQRVLFHHVVENNDVPMCKSSDFEVGYPNPDAPRNKSFPWDASGFDPMNFPPDAEGNIKLPCASCQLKEWGTDPKSDAPYCAEQWTIPLYYDTTGNGDWSPAILTLQKSSIKPIRSYYTSFSHANEPPFLAIAQGSLKVMERGTVKYSVPTFIKEGESPRERWQEFADQFNEMRAFLRRPPSRDENTQPAPSDNTVTAPPQQQQAPQPVAQPVTTQAPPEDPWAAPAQPAAPAQAEQAPPPAQPAPPVGGPVGGPVTQQPPAPAAQPAPPAQPAVEQSAPPANDGLPF